MEYFIVEFVVACIIKWHSSGVLSINQKYQKNKETTVMKMEISQILQILSSFDLEDWEEHNYGQLNISNKMTLP